MNCIIEVRSDRTYHTAITTSAAKKRNPDTPVMNVGIMSLCLVATQRNTSADATSITRMKHTLTIMALNKSSDHTFIATNPQMVSRQQSAMLCTMYLLLSLLIFITLRILFYVDLYTETYYVLLHLHEAATNIEGFLLAVRQRVDHPTLVKRRDNRCVVDEDFELAQRSRNQHALHLTFELNPFGRNYLQLKHKVQCSMFNVQ